MSLITLIAVSIGGAIGALCRSIATNTLKPRFPGNFPTHTLLINITSCTLAGIALYFAAHMDTTLYLALTMGFLGGFSTLSTMNYEAVELITAHQAKTGFAYLGASYASTLLVAALGFYAASLIA